MLAAVLLMLLWVMPVHGWAEVPLAAAIEAELVRAPASPARDALMGYYQRLQFAPVWIDQGEPSARLDGLLNAIEGIDRQGLVPEHYGSAVLRSLRLATSSSDRARLEVRASLAAVRMATDLQSGRRAPQLVDPELFVYPRSVEVGRVMEGVLASDDIQRLYAEWAPISPDYRRLQQGLEQYRGILAAGGWRITQEGPVLKPGMADPWVRLLRARLDAEGYPLPAAPEDPDHYDEELIVAVRQFQQRNGLEPDGVIGQGTRAALAVSVEQRIRQIELNMERLRWMPDDLGKRHVRVNIAAFELALVRDGEPLLEMPVAVGRPYRRTPVFSGQLAYIEFNPTWTVPPTILHKDLLPRLKKDAKALDGLGMRLFDRGEGAREIDFSAVDWNALSGKPFPYRLRQDPGPKNPLGRVKFMFPNEHDVYLHDTPDRTVFNHAMRAFSSGCIRVARADALALALLADQPSGWTEDRVATAMVIGPPQRVRLATPIPVHLTYITSWVGADGELHFRQDIYGRDKRLDQALRQAGIAVLNTPTEG